ncbi:hypothetical protein Tco_1340129, partial [Tanacetum coccineum]
MRLTISPEEDEIIYSQLDDARYDRARLRARVNMLYRDRPFHRRTALLMEEEARLSRAADRRRQSVISDLLKADYRRQRQLVEALKIVKSLKTQMIELQRQQGPAKDLVEPELPEEANLLFMYRLLCTSPPPNSPTYVEGSLGSRAAGIRQRDALPSPVHETEMPEICLPLCKRPRRTTPGPGYEVGESSAAGTARQVGPATARADLYGFAERLDTALGCQTSRELGYGITNTWDDLVGAIQEIA